MVTRLLPPAEQCLEAGVRRSVVLLRAGYPVDAVARVLTVAGYAAALIDSETERLNSD
jgi:hypothetical protein